MKNEVTPRTMESGKEGFQLVALLGTVFLFTTFLYVLRFSIAPYVGVFVSALGIAVSIGQLYIHSVVDQVLLLVRRDFYRGASWSQLLFGGFILFLSISDIILQNITYGMVWNDGKYIAELLYYLAFLFGISSLPAMLVVTLSYLYPIKYVDVKTDYSLLKLWKFNNQLKRLKNGTIPKGLYIFVEFSVNAMLLFMLISIAWLVLQLLFSSNISQDLRDTLTPLASENKGAPQLILGLSICIALAFISAILCVLSLFSYRLYQILNTREEGLYGFSFFLAMQVLFIFPPLLQIIYGYNAFVGSSTLITLIIVIFIAIVTFFLVKIVPDVIRKPAITTLGYYSGTKTEYTTALLLLATSGVLTALYPIFWSTQDIPFPLYYFSFLFYVLACNFMAAVDLRVSSQAVNNLREAAVDDKFVSNVAHEIYNPLLPVQSFIFDETIPKILNRSIDNDKKLENTRKSLVELHDSAKSGLSQAISYTQELKDRGSFALVNIEKVDLFEVLQPLVDEYRESNRFISLGSVSLNLIPPEAKILAFVDIRLFKSVLRILLDNAVDATQIGLRDNQITIQVNKELTGKASITIRDTGGGMNTTQKGRFGHPQITNKPAGTGVGTAIATRFMRDMSGSLNLMYSELNSGTSINLLLKAA